MAYTTEYIDFILDVLAPLGEVRSRKLMGDYVIYLNGKCVITACDNIAFIKRKAIPRTLLLDMACDKETF
jgi:TfoX/Sxy family transcriptional regulator of competence genes